MQNKRTYVISIFTLLSVIIVLSITYILDNHFTYNPAGTIGNTAGNLNNSGLFCEYDGRVYFSNSYDGSCLYSMDVTEENVTKLTNIDACNILAGGEYVYYFYTSKAASNGMFDIRTPHSFHRITQNGQKTMGLTRDVIITAQLVDNYLYYLTTENSRPAFKKMKIDKSELTTLSDSAINPACAVNGTIYYNGTENDHYLYSYDTITGVTNELFQGNIWYPIVEGDYVYYLDVTENYRLCRYSFSQNLIEVLTQDRVDCFNIGSGYIYYQKNGTSPSLNCMHTDGTQLQVIAEGNYTKINMTSQFVYFRAFGDENTTYHTRLGSDSFDRFIPQYDSDPDLK